MKTVLITGATGFIGFHCLKPLLERNFTVHAVTIDPPPPEPAGVIWHRADLLDPAAVKQLCSQVRPAYLLHLAWYMEHGLCWESTENLRWLRAGIDLLQSFIGCGGQRMVAAGTCAEYDWRYGYCSERFTPVNPVSLYAASKHALHTAVTAAGKQAGISVAWARIFYLYGPREGPNRLVASVITALLRGEPALCSQGKQIRDYLHVSDVAGALVALLDSPVTGPVNIASGRPLALKEIIYAAAEQAGHPELVRLGAREAPPGEPPLLVADTRRLNEEVGWQPRFDLKQGMQDTVAWWLDKIG